MCRVQGTEDEVDRIVCVAGGPRKWQGSEKGRRRFDGRWDLLVAGGDGEGY